MSYFSNLKTFKLCYADLTLAAYATSAVYQLSNLTGNFTPSVSSGVVTLPAGRYMLEGYPYVDIAATNDLIQFVWQSDDGGFSDVGLVGQVQVVGDSMGERDVALAVIDSDTAVDVRLIVKTLTSTGTPTDAGGCVIIWREL